MSRAAAATQQKGAQKAALKEKAAEHAADLAMGLTSTMKKLMAADTLLCTVCSATQLGPKVACECPGGRTKPSADFETKHALLAAAMAREKLRKDAARGASAAQQQSVRAAKEKSKAARDASDALAELDLAELDMVDVVFEPGQKLGMSLEKNAVSAVATGGVAEGLKVQVGWVLRRVNGDEAGATKAAIMKLCGAAMKAGAMTITFQTPLEDGQHHCCACDKFIDSEQFDGASAGLEVGPGKQTCCSCEEYADMGFE